MKHSTSKVLITFMWKWHFCGEPRAYMVHVRLENARRAYVPLPPHLLSDASLKANLEKAAAMEAEVTCCPCTYLGRLVGEGNYEPNRGA